MLLLATLLTFSACEDKSEPEKNPFVGTWTCTQYQGANNQYRNDLVLTIKKDFTAELIFKTYMGGKYTGVTITNCVYSIEEGTSRPTMYMSIPEIGHYNQRWECILVDQQLLVTLQDMFEPGVWENATYQEYTKQ